MVNLERTIGGMRARAWGLIVNFCFNFIGLYGLSAVLDGRDGDFLLWLGAAGTLCMLLLLSTPAAADEERMANRPDRGDRT